MKILKLKFKYFVFSVLILAMLACNMPVGQQAPVAAQGALVYLLVTPNPNASQTPTPFQPVTSTPRPTNLPTATSTQVVPPTSTATSIPTALPAAVFGKYPDGQVRIMVMGSDARPGGGFRTDIMMIVSINPGTGNVTALSFPRDLYVNIPGWGMNRLNTAMEFGGFRLMQSTLETNFGVRPNHYILTNFNSFLSIVDSLGGVDVVAGMTFSDRCKFAAPGKVDGVCYIKPGTIHMDSTMTLWYVRSRKTTSDIDRERRSQEVLQAMFRKLFSLQAITRIPELYDLYRKNVETDLSVNDIISLAPVAAGLALDSKKMRRYTIGAGAVYDYTVPDSGAMVLMPNVGVIQGLIKQAVFTP
jgi:polyisoprenyl-teichoic acid--peptidoglycan teichoic acid transferase